jgi:hypothetical protein
MALLDELARPSLMRFHRKLESVLSLCPEEFLIFDHFFEQDDLNNISYTVGIPYEVYGYPLNVDKQFLPFIQSSRKRDNYFLLQRATQLLQESAKENELSMIYYSDDGEEDFEGFSSMLWSYHPGHKKLLHDQLGLARKLSRLLLGVELANPPSEIITSGELGHVGVAVRSARKIIKYYLRSTNENALGILQSLSREMGLPNDERFNILRGSTGKTIIFFDCEDTKIIRFGVELRPEIFNQFRSDLSILNLPENIQASLSEFSQLSSNLMEYSTGEERFRMHHLKLSVTEKDFRWKAYYAYNIKN